MTDNSSKPDKTFDVLKVLELISKSNTSLLYKVYPASFPHRVYACKKILVNKIPLANCKMLVANLKSIQKLIHPNIIKYYKIFHKNDKIIYLIMDYFPRGSIFDLLSQQQKPLDEKRTKIWFSQILGVVSYIHYNGIAHRNINLNSILIRSDEMVILSSFLNNCFAYKLETDIMKSTITNQPIYQSPEMNIFSSQIWPYNAKAADIYALGICLFQMINYDPPFGFYEENPLDYMLKQRLQKVSYNEKYESAINDKMKNLILRLLEPMPGIRITAHMALLHEALAPN